MNQVTIQKMTAMVVAKGKIGSRFTVETVQMNNKYRLTTPNGCRYIAKIQWGEFGWPDVDGVSMKIEGCY
jgi:hypothetical protein